MTIDGIYNIYIPTITYGLHAAQWSAGTIFQWMRYILLYNAYVSEKGKTILLEAI